MKKESLQKYCEKNGYKLSDNADEIIEIINKKKGLCPCKFLAGTRCLCPEHKAEIKEFGHCHCGLIYED